MNSKLFGSLVALGLAVSGFAGADSFDDLAGNVNVKIENETGYTIREIYLSPVTDRHWERDLLGNGTLQNGWVDTIKTAPGMYDLKLIDSDGDACIVNNVSMFMDRSVTISRSALLGCEGYN